MVETLSWDENQPLDLSKAPSLVLCTVCSEDSVSASLAENILSLTGELAEGTRILAACYDSDGQLSDVKILVWHGEPIAEEIPLEKTVKLFLVDANWSPLRKFIPLR